MDAFEIYVHGTPRGHQIWGSEHNHDYIANFYNIVSRATGKVALQIDICNGNTYYTYLRQQNVYDVEGRPRAFFAMTIAFNRSQCTDVYRLYQLFDAVYNQICAGTILKTTADGENYLVADLREAHSGTTATVDKIQAAFAQKIPELISPTLQPLTSADTFAKSKKTVSLLDVDSPLFFENVKKHSVIVYPDMQPAAVALESLSNELRQLTEQNKSLSTTNKQFKTDIAALSQENKALTGKSGVTSAAIVQKIDSLNRQLATVTNERDILQQRLQDFSHTLSSIEKPCREILLLSNGENNENPKFIHDGQDDKPHGATPKHQTQGAHWSLNSLLLVLVLVCSGINMMVGLKSCTTQPVAVNDEEEPVEVPDSINTYLEWDDCQITVDKKLNNLLNRGREHLIQVQPNGSQRGMIRPGTFIFYYRDEYKDCFNTNASGTIKVENSAPVNAVVQVDYVCNDTVFLSQKFTVN